MRKEQNRGQYGEGTPTLQRAAFKVLPLLASRDFGSFSICIFCSYLLLFPISYSNVSCTSHGGELPIRPRHSFPCLRRHASNPFSAQNFLAGTRYCLNLLAESRLDTTARSTFLRQNNRHPENLQRKGPKRQGEHARERARRRWNTGAGVSTASAPTTSPGPSLFYPTKVRYVRLGDKE